MGQLETDLSPHPIIGVDTAPFIYFWEQHPRYFAPSEVLFRTLKEPEVQGITSIITLIETCVHPQREGRLDLVDAYERSLVDSQQVRMVPIDIALARRAVNCERDMISTCQMHCRFPLRWKLAPRLLSQTTAV